MEGLVKGILIAVIGIVIVTTLISATITTVATAGDAVNATGYPLASLFAHNSILPLVFIAGGLVAVLGLAFAMWKSKMKY